MKVLLFSGLCALAFSAQANDFNYSQDEYITIRGIERCVNRQGWDNEQEVNDQLITQLLGKQGIDLDADKLRRDSYQYEKLQSSLLVEINYQIAEREQHCLTNLDIAALIVEIEPLDRGTLSASLDELL